MRQSLSWSFRVARGLCLVAAGSQLSLMLAGCNPPPPNAAQPMATGDGSVAAVAPNVAQAAPAANVTDLAPQGSVAQAAGLPLPSVALAQAVARLLDGDYLKAIQDFATIQVTYPGTAEAAEAALRQAEAALADDQLTAAEEQLRTFLDRYPDDPRQAVATLMLGRTLESQGNGGAAIEMYRRYEQLADPSASLADFLHLRAARIYFAAERPADAWAELSQAATAADQSPSATARIRTYDELSTRYWNAGDRARTLAARQAAFDATVAARRPVSQIAASAWRLVSAAAETGNSSVANQVRWRLVNEWPKTFNALQAMNEIGPEKVNLFQKGLIYYANNRWSQASQAFTTYINMGAPEGEMDRARYMRAIALVRLGDDEAVAALDRVFQQHPESPLAPSALWEAGNLLLRQDNKPAAAARYEQLAVNYPLAEERGKALYKLSKLLPELGKGTEGRRYLEAASTAGHEDFFTFRARTALRQPSPAPKPLEGQEQISEADKQAWAGWLAAHAHSVDAQAEKRASVEQDARFKRGTALLIAGFRKEAEEEFLELVRVLEYDPVTVAHVAIHVREHGFFPLSVTLGHNLLNTVRTMGEPSLLNAPRVVQKLVLPLAFIRLVEPAAKAKGVDPLLLLGLMKQESWFEPRALSSASARGLTQFIPETARSVARELNWTNWTWDDMNRPYVSVSFGAHYLSSLIKDFRGNYHFALAGYNAGPGRVLGWAKGDWNRDLDLFVEEISFAETRGYVKSVVGNYELYKAIYYR
ncbi:MAG TPA: transglycosylase SLT domain-containing protein [Chloroflexota bacterium]|nr:transglycosylase SLT domain-containing protein [Chloroflexota bacterium]